ncbi:acyltransferase family protein [Roseivirga sp.]|uniref:acyltransferase family protein n=1 Tax=Roseivirga sp. TaxID=1964215 RepID=UPI003B8B334E
MKLLNKQLQSLTRNTGGKRYIPFVDGIRFMAIIPVVLLHATERFERYVVTPSSNFETELSYVISRGAIGVMIFFTLSGFILSLPFAKQYSRFSYKKYLSKRLTRLEPPYILWMTIFGLIFFFKQNIGLSELLNHYAASIFYVHNISYGEFSIINPVAWSLEVEIQYYLFAPFLAMCYFRQNKVALRRTLLLAFTLVFIVVQHQFGWQYLPTKASILGQLQHFMVGLLMADFYVNEPKWHKEKNRLWDLIGFAAVLTLMFTWTEELGKSVIFMVAMLALFASALKGKLIHQILTYRWIAVIGGMCYTIYLTHLPLLELLYSLIARFGYSSPYWVQLTISLIIAIPIVLISSMIFYKYTEQPFMSKDVATKIKQQLTDKWMLLKGRLITKLD